MAHQPMHINNWIEIDKDLKWYIEEKARVIKEEGKSHSLTRITYYVWASYYYREKGYRLVTRE